MTWYPLTLRPPKFKFPMSHRKCQSECKICPQSTPCPYNRASPQRASTELCRTEPPLLSTQGHLQIEDAVMEGFYGLTSASCFFSLVHLQAFWGETWLSLSHLLFLFLCMGQVSGKGEALLPRLLCPILCKHSTPTSKMRLRGSVFGTEN